MSEVLRYEEPIRLFRFLINDGRVIDVEARRDDSNLRGWLLDQLKIERSKTTRWDGAIVGVTEVPASEPEPVKKRVVRRPKETT